MTDTPFATEPLPPWETDRILPPDKEALLRARLARYETNVEDSLQYRPHGFHHRYLPWMASELRLEGATVLEVGAGDGAATVQFAERGARVMAVDVNAVALETVRFRAELHDVADRIDTRAMNGAEIGTHLSGPFDIVAYPACLEHMTHDERQRSLAGAWGLLSSGGALVVVDTPNRLWYFDVHTAFLDFFHWLPDDVAIDYASRSTRAGFNTAFTGVDREAARLKLTRWGRGVSFHDFELALGSIDHLRVVGEWDYRRAQHPEWAAGWMSSRDGRFHGVLREITPRLPAPWFDPELAFIAWKP